MCPRQALAVLNAWRRASGGYTCGGAPNADTSVAAIHHPISTRENTFAQAGTLSSQASSRTSDGFTVLSLSSSCKGQSLFRRDRIRRINRCPVHGDVFRTIGNRF